jgi:hypothetical protein
MPFGLCNAPPTFQRIITDSLQGIDDEHIKFYVDDILIATETFEEMIVLFGKVCTRLREAGLLLQPGKCEMFRDHVDYLGSVLSKDGLQPQKGKIRVIRECPVPKDAQQVRRFLGFVSFYRRFIPNMSKIARPLHEQTKKHIEFNWDDKCQEAFDTLKERMCSTPLLLQYPDFNKPFTVITDASGQGLGAILQQDD